MKLYSIGFDMDMVLTDFLKAHKQQYREDQQYPQASARFFDNLEPLMSSGIYNIEFVKKLILLGHDVSIVTSPSIPNFDCWSGKAVWLNKYFGLDMLKKTIMTYDKSKVKGNIDILVDDSTKNGQLSFGEGLMRYGSKEYPDMASVFQQINKWSKEGKEFL